jgi:hypothetical protein
MWPEIWIRNIEEILMMLMKLAPRKMKQKKNFRVWSLETLIIDVETTLYSKI